MAQSEISANRCLPVPSQVYKKWSLAPSFARSTEAWKPAPLPARGHGEPNRDRAHRGGAAVRRRPGGRADQDPDHGASRAPISPLAMSTQPFVVV